MEVSGGETPPKSQYEKLLPLLLFEALIQYRSRHLLRGLTPDDRQSQSNTGCPADYEVCQIAVCKASTATARLLTETHEGLL